MKRSLDAPEAVVGEEQGLLIQVADGGAVALEDGQGPGLLFHAARPLQHAPFPLSLLQQPPPLDTLDLLQLVLIEHDRLPLLDHAVAAASLLFLLGLSRSGSAQEQPHLGHPGHLLVPEILGARPSRIFDDFDVIVVVVAAGSISRLFLVRVRGVVGPLLLNLPHQLGSDWPGESLLRAGSSSVVVGPLLLLLGRGRSN